VPSITRKVLDMLVQRRRDGRAALRLMRKLLKKQGFAPKLLVTDKLCSYAAAFRHLQWQDAVAAA
jgi:putative transposase